MIENAKILIEACNKACKGNPFCSPLIIFDNAKTMQWFKKMFVDNAGIFANVRMSSLNFFLKEQLELLSGKQVIKSNALAHKIMIFLANNIFTPELEKVRKYGQPDVNNAIQFGKLYDFSVQLTDLFLKYQNVEDPECCFTNSNPNADWQKYLYDNVFAHEPTLRNVFQNCSNKPDFRGNPIFYFGTEAIEPLYKQILKAWEIKADNYLYTQTYSDLSTINHSLPSINIVAAPSKVRELESVHSHICQLLKDGAKLSEMLVVVPNLDDYRTSIHQVFAIPKDTSNVHIPYAIVDADATDSFTQDFLKTFFNIAAKGDFNRKDFFDIVNNPVVRAVREITAEEVKCFDSWTEKMHVFRNGNQRDDWHKAVKRMLLAKFTTETIGEILPFEDMASKSDSTLSKFVRCINDLSEWIDLTKNGFATNKLDELYDLLRSWMLIKLMPPELEMERLSYSGAMSACKGLEVWKDAGVATIPLEVIARTVIDGAVTCSATSAELFVGGLSFMRFSPNSVIPSNYTFMLGMDSKTMPGRDVKNTIDLRTNSTSRSEENKTAFYTTLARTQKQIFYSYINTDLVKDEIFFMSNLLEELKNKFQIELENLKIDENRDFDKLFTNRSIRHKHKNKALFNSPKPYSTNAKLDALLKDLELPRRVSLANLKKYLEDPFQFQIGRLIDTDDLDISQNTQWEPLMFEPLEEWAYLHEMVEDNLDENGFKDKHKNENALPATPFGDEAIKELITLKDKILDAMDNCNVKISTLNKGVVVEKSLTCNNTEWLLRGECSWHTNDGKTFVDVRSSKVENKHFLKTYLSALAYWASKDEVNEIKISLLLFNGGKDGIIKCFTLKNANEACEILNAIFEAAFSDCYHNVVPIDIIDANTLDYYGYLNKFDSSYTECWKYFSKKTLFDIKEVCGFNKTKFPTEWEIATGKMKAVIKFLK